jgi:hypothetical protein
LLTSGGGSCKRENSGADNGTDADASKIESGKRTFELALGRSRLGHQVIWAFGLEKM